MNNEKGYILVFFSFFATILGLSANYLMIKSDVSGNFQRALRLGSIVEEHGDQVKTLLASYQQCTNNLNGQVIGSELQILGGNPLVKSAPSLDRTDGVKVLAPGQIIETPIGPIEISSIRVEMKDHIVTGNPQEHLIISADLNPEARKNSNIFNSKAIRIPLKVNKIGNVIQECLYDEGNFIEQRINANCTKVGGTLNSIWDKCNIPADSLAGDEVNCGFDMVRVERIDGSYQIVCGEGV